MVHKGSEAGAAATAGGLPGRGLAGRGVAGSVGLTAGGLGRLGVWLKVPLKVPPAGLVGTKTTAGGAGGAGGGGVTAATSGT